MGLFGILAVMAAIPLSVPVRFETTAAGLCDGTVIAESARTKTSTPVRSNSAVLEVAPEENWQISLRDSTCWAMPVTINPPKDIPDGGLVIRTWPKRSVRGTWKLPAGAHEPKGVQVTLQSAPGATEASGLATKVLQPCANDGAAWRCEVPAGVLDLRFEAEGFVPVYVWDRDLREKDADLGVTRLETGASLAGWVVRPEGDTASAEVELRPSAVAETAGVTQRLNAQALKAKTNGRGFFQFSAVPAGMYTMTAKAEGAAATRVDDIRIAEPREYALEKIRLQSLGRVDVVLTPALTPGNGPWKVQLRPLGKTVDQQPEVLAKQAVNEDGHWSRGGLEPGLYVLGVYDEAGSRVADRELDIRGQTERVQITIGEIQVRGRVRMGTKSMPGKLRFESGGTRVEMATDDSGAFTGTLPTEGTWHVQVSFADVLQRLRVQRVSVKRNDGESVARVDIDLPGGVIEGRVVDDQGNGVPQAEVRVLREALAETNGATDESGHFTLVGMQNGAVQIHALKDRVESEQIEYSVADNSAPVTLRLRDNVTVRGRVVMPNGLPVTGALIRYFYGARSREPAVSGPSGYFALQVPRGLRSVVVVVLATGLPIKLGELGIPADGNSLEITMEGVGGTLVVRPGEEGQLPLLYREAAAIGLHALFAPRDIGPPREMRDDGFHFEVESGPYAVCVRDRCIHAMVAPNGRAVADFRTEAPLK